MGLFLHDSTKEKKLVWMDFIRCEENYLKKLIKLQKNKEKYKENSKEKEFAKTIKEIQSIQNQIRLDQVKLKIKAKIENRLLI